MPRYLNPSSFLNTNSLNVQDTLCGKRYRVPEYQREFMWDNTQFDQLWDDLTELFNRNVVNGSIVPNPRPHFLGSIVIQEADPNVPEPRLELIDGQQRLTTISCIASILREFADQVTDNVLKRMLNSTLDTMLGTFAGGSADPVLRLGREDSFFYESVVSRFTQADRIAYWNTQNISKRPTAQRIRDCIELFFYPKIHAFVCPNQTQDDQRLEKLISVLTEMVVLMEVRVQDHEMAYHLFEALNFRGLDLSQADLIKNELLKRADPYGTQIHNQVASHWVEMLDNLANQDRVDTPGFIQLHFLSNYGAARATDLFETVKKQLNQISPNAYAKSLADESKLFSDLINGRPEWSAAKEALEDIKKPLDVTMAYPLLLAAAVRFLNNHDDFVKMAKTTANFVFRYFKVQKASVGQLTRVISESARTLRDVSLSPTNAVDLLRAESTDATFEAIMGDASFNSPSLGFYVIAHIEAFITAGAGVTIFGQSPVQHLEHILPRTHNGADWSHVPFEEAEVNMWRLGNLTVLEREINAFVKNKAFDEKNNNSANKDFQHSSLKLPSKIVDYLDNGKWTVKSIHDRQIALIQAYASQSWPLKW